MYHAAYGNADDIFSAEEELETRCTAVGRQPADIFLYSSFFHIFIFFKLQLLKF